MDAYLISVGIIGFGGWIVANSKVESGIFPIWFVLGLLTIAVGLMSLLGEIRGRRWGVSVGGRDAIVSLAYPVTRLDRCGGLVTDEG